MKRLFQKTAILAILMTSLGLYASVDIEVPEAWTAEGYQYNMTFYAQVFRPDGTAIDHERSVLAAFDARGACRGSISPIDGPGGRLFMLGIASDSPEEPGLVLKVLDAVSGETYIIAETVDFASDAVEPENGLASPRPLHVLGTDVSLRLEPGWNLAALTRPVTAESLAKLLALAPLRLDEARQAYVRCSVAEDLQAGAGYWFFSPGEQRVELAPDMSQAAWDVPAPSGGWNLVGASTETPDWLPQARQMYIWEDGQYRLVRKLVPGQGVWADLE